jgi:hypothetical protein
MRALLRFYQYINILSLDIVAGAVISALFFAKIFQVQVKQHGLTALALTVWIVYTLDHLRDAKKIKHPASMQRHRFHQKHFHFILVFLVLAIVLDAVTIFFIRRQVFEWGLILSAIVILYLMAQQSLRFLKEFFIAALYTCGILLLSITVTTITLGLTHYLLILQFGCIAWINLVLFSWFDQVFDLQDEQKSFVTIVGERSTQCFLYGMFAFGFGLSIAELIISGPLIPILILFAMNVVLLLIFVWRTALAKNDVYRLIGDAVFMLPVIQLFYHE